MSGASRWWVIAMLIACGGGALPPPAAPPQETASVEASPIATAVARDPMPTAEPAKAAAPADPPPAPFDRATLPEWSLTIPPKARTDVGVQGPYTVYAANASADHLLVGIAKHTPFISVASGKRVSGRFTAPNVHIAFHTVAAHLGVALPPLESKGHHPTDVAFHFAAAPVRDLVRVLADVGGMNIVVGPGELPAINVFVRRMKAERVLAVMTERLGRKLVTQKNVRFLVAADAAIPALRKKLPAGAFDLDADGATVAQIVAGVRALAKLDIGACSDRVVTLRLRGVTLAQLVQAVEVASGESFAAVGDCISRTLADEPAAELAARVFVRSKAQRAVVFDHEGATVVGRPDGKRIERIDGTSVVFTDQTMLAARRRPTEPWAGKVTRTAALFGDHAARRAIVETTDGQFHSVEQNRSMQDVEIEVTEDGVVLRTVDGAPTIPLAP